MRTRTSTAVAVPSMLGGLLAAHTLAYRWTVPAAERAQALRDTGQGWPAQLPLAAAPVLALLAVGLVRRVLAPRSGAPAAWPFAILPPLAFLLEEQLQRLCQTGSLRPTLEAPVADVVLLAAPFGLVAYLLARSLLGLADAASDSLRAAPGRLPRWEQALVPVRAAARTTPVPAAVRSRGAPRAS